MGTCDGRNESIDIYFNPRYSTMKGVLRAIFHEIEHAIQDEKLKSGIFNDYRLLEYQKDYLLQFLLKDEYYEENLKVISFEYDAELKALIEVLKMYDHLEGYLVKFNCKDENELMKNEGFINLAEYLISKRKTKKRKYKNKEYDLDDLFLKAVNKGLKKYGSVLTDYIESDFWVLDLEHDFSDNKVVRKDLFTLIDEYIYCKDDG